MSAALEETHEMPTYDMTHLLKYSLPLLILLQDTFASSAVFNIIQKNTNTHIGMQHSIGVQVSHFLHCKISQHIAEKSVHKQQCKLEHNKITLSTFNSMTLNSMVSSDLHQTM
jgi:hypothetical protein